MGALEKEIRLSFAARIRGTVPEPYRFLISEAKEQDTPPFKYDSPQTPYAEPARNLLQLLRTKAPDNDIVTGPLEAIESLATTQGLDEPSLPAIDAYVTSICYLGSKSLSHMLSQIERCKDRLLALGSRAEPATRLQIISSVMDYWAEKPGIGVSVVDKLLNYTILTPTSVVLWALGPDRIGIGDPLCHAYIYEMVAGTVSKVTQRVRQIVTASHSALQQPDEQTAALLGETLTKEREAMRVLFGIIEDGLIGIADGSADAVAESAAQDDGVSITLLRRWGRRWLLVFRRWQAVEEAWANETIAAASVAAEVAVAAAAEAEAQGLKPSSSDDTKMEDVPPVAPAIANTNTSATNMVENVETNGGGSNDIDTRPAPELVLAQTVLANGKDGPLVLEEA